MPATVHIPIRVRTDPPAAATRADELAAAVAAAAGRAARNARLVVGRQWPGLAVPQPPTFTWTGIGREAVPRDVRDDIETRIRAAVSAAVAEAGLIDREPSAAPRPLPPDPREAFDPSRFDAAAETYLIPTYDDRGVAVEVGLTTDTPPGDRRTLIRSARGRLAKGDRKLLVGLLLGSIPGAADILKGVAEVDPALIRRLLRELFDEQTATAAKSLVREDFVLSLDVQVQRDLVPTFREVITVLAAAFTAARTLPAAAGLVDEWERKTRGVKRLLGLVDALLEVRGRLLAELEAGPEPTDEAVKQKIRTGQVVLVRLAAILVTVAGTPKAAELYPAVERDLREAVRWIGLTHERVRAIDNLLGVYRLLYGEAADKLAEVVALRQARDAYLTPAADGLFPKTEWIAARVRDAERSYADWQGRAGDQKLARVREGLTTLRKIAGQKDGAPYYNYTALPLSSKHGYFRPSDEPYNARVLKTVRDIVALDRAVTAAGSAVRDEAYLREVSRLDHEIGPLAVRVQLLTFWYASTAVRDGVIESKVGFAWERKGLTLPHRPTGLPMRSPGWVEILDDIRWEASRQYENPDYPVLNDRFATWKEQLERVQRQVQSAADREFWIAVGIVVFATIVTLGVGSAVAAGGGGLVLVTLAEAATFTLVSNAGQSLLLEKPLEPFAMAGEFVENAALFGVFRVLNVAALAGARWLLPGRAVAQLAAVFGANVVVGSGIPYVLAEMERRERGDDDLPAETKGFLIANLVLTALLFAFTGKKMLASLEALNRRDILVRLEQLNQQAAGLGDELRSFISSPNRTQAEFEAFKAKVGRIAPEFERLLGKLAAFPEAELTRLGLTRAQVLEFARMTGEMNKAIQGARYEPPPPVRKALRAPDQVLDLVPTADGTFEYNPAAAANNPSAMTAQLKGAGYVVTDLGGGVLRLAAPSGGRPVLLLPAPDPGQTGFGRTPQERALGWRPPAERVALADQMKAINPELVNPELVARLGGEASDEAVLSALSLIAENRAKLTTRWSIDEVRGLVAVQELRQAIPRSVVNRLFKTLTEAQLRDLFGKFQAILSNQQVAGGARHLIQGRATPEKTLATVEAYDAVRLARLEMPELTAEAASGLVTPTKPSVTDLVAELGAVPKADRVKWLEARNPLQPPKPRPTPLAEAVTLEYAEKSARLLPGIDLMAGTPADVAAALEKATAGAGGTFSTPEVRERFVAMVGKYRSELYKVRDGAKTERNNLESALDEVALAYAQMKQGSAVVVFSENRAKYILDVPTAQFTGPNGFKLTNAPATIQLLFDGVFLTKTNEFKVIETTVGGPLSLPTEFAGLDPQGPSPGAPADYTKLDRSAQNVTKVLQLLKYRAAVDTAAAIGEGFRTLRGGTGPPPKVVLEIHATGFTAQFQRAAEALGFKCVVKP